MFEYRMRHITVSVLVILLTASVSVSTETWRLSEQQTWKTVSQDEQGKYLLAVGKIKQLVNTGQTQQVIEAADQLKKDFPEIAGPDLDAFIEAEVLYSKGKYTKAVRSYDSLLNKFPQSRLYDAALDRQFDIATAVLAGQRKRVLKVFRIKGYAEGTKVMEKISDRVGEAPIAQKAALAIVESLEKREKFEDAYHQWSYIASRWPTGQIGKDALLGMARCKHAAYRGPKYDYSNLVSARSYYQNFKLRYPEEAQKLDIDKKVQQITEQQAYKQFNIGRYYQKTDNKQAANFYYQMVIDNWPESTAAKMAKEQIAFEDTKPQESKEEKK